MKNFFDHLGYRFMVHRPEPAMFTKRAVILTTAAGAGMGRTARLMQTNLFHWGVPEIHRYALRIAALSFGEISDRRMRRIRKDMAHLARKIEKTKKPRQGILSRGWFWLMQQVQKKNNWNALDREHWQAQGWISRP